MERRQWCLVELDMFVVANFDVMGDRMWHTRGLDEGREPHFADGFSAHPEKDDLWRPPTRMAPQEPREPRR